MIVFNVMKHVVPVWGMEVLIVQIVISKENILILINN